jgi:hypothetical protein
VGEDQAHRYSTLLLTSVRWIIGMRASGRLTADRWRTDANGVLTLLIGMIGDR